MESNSLNSLVLIEKSQALNIDGSIAHVLDMRHEICSDADPEVLLQVTFSSPVEIREIRVAGEDLEHRPGVLKIVPGTYGFDEMTESKTSFRLTYKGGVATLKLPPQAVRQDTAYTVLLLDNEADDELTKFHGIEFYGSARSALDTRGKTLNCKS